MKKTNYSSLRLYVLILFAVYQLFSLSMIDFNNKFEPTTITIYTLSLTILTSLLWILFLYLATLLIVVFYQENYKLFIVFTYTIHTIVYIIKMIINYIQSRTKAFDVVRC